MSVQREQWSAAAAPQDGPHVAILMGVRNGAPWLDAQLASLSWQSHANWSLIVSDDGSTDDSRAQLDASRDTDARAPVQVISGPGQGFVRNYLSLLGRVGPGASYIALADQDDVWLPHRLGRAVDALAAVPPGVPGLYLAATLITDRNLRVQRNSRPVRIRPQFRNALVQCIGGGNTMVLNRAALNLLRAAAPEAILATGGTGPTSHDWWAYQMVSGAGGCVIADPRPCLLYRQHGSNLSGSNRGLRACVRRAAQVLRGDARRMTDRNLAALGASAHRLSPQNRAILRDAAAARELPPIARIRTLVGVGLHRQSRPGTLALYAAAGLGLF